MKIKYKIAVLLAALFLAPLFAARADSPDFTLEDRRVLTGMSRSWLQGYGPDIRNNTLTLILPILSDRAQGDIQAEWTLADESLSPFKPQNMAVKAQRNESGLWALRFSLSLHADRQNGDYPGVIRVTGRDGSGNALSADFPYTLRIRDGQPTKETLRLDISLLRTDLKVGEEGEIALRVTNPFSSLLTEPAVLIIVLVWTMRIDINNPSLNCDRHNFTLKIFSQNMQIHGAIIFNAVQQLNA